MIVLATAAMADEVELRQSELEVKRRVQPEYPRDMRRSGQEGACLAVVTMDEEGLPLDVVARDCDPAFAAATEAALLEWRWYPPEVDGEPVRARTTISVAYRMEDEDGETSLPEYFELFGGCGALHAPDDPSAQDPADTAGLVRVWAASGLDSIGARRLTLAGDLDVRGFATYAAHGRALAGVNGIAGPVRGMLGAGFGVTQRGILHEPTLAWFVPIGASIVATPTGWGALHARGGVDLAPGRAPAPEAVGGLTFGSIEDQGVFGFRIEAGWRRELGADTLTAAVGVGL